MAYDTIRSESLGGVETIALDRPRQLNAMSAPMAAEVWDVLRSLDQARVLVVTGSERVFSAGADLKEGPDAGREPDWNTVLDRIAALPIPTIAAIEGWCLGGGLELALTCDLRIAGASARFGLPEALRGLLPGGGGTQRLPRTIGPTRAKWVMFTGEHVAAETAEGWGLLNEVVEDGAALARAQEVAGAILRAAPLSIAAIKSLVDGGLDHDLGAGLALERARAVAVSTSDDAAEGIRAFAERRDPDWVGR